MPCMMIDVRGLGTETGSCSPSHVSGQAGWPMQYLTVPGPPATTSIWEARTWSDYRAAVQHLVG